MYTHALHAIAHKDDAFLLDSAFEKLSQDADTPYLLLSLPPLSLSLSLLHTHTISITEQQY